MQNRKFKIHYNFVFDNLIQEFGENPADAHTYIWSSSSTARFLPPRKRQPELYIQSYRPT